MRLNISEEFKDKVMDGEAEFIQSKKGLTLGEAVKKIDRITISNKGDKTIVQCYNKELFVGDWTVREVRFEKGHTLTIADIDLRLKFSLD